MRTTTLEEFRKSLIETGAYKTASDCLAPRPRKPSAWVTASMTWSVFSVFPFCCFAETARRLTTDLWAHFCFAAYRKAEKLGCPITLEGWETARDYKGPVVFVSNHMSTLETIMLPPAILTFKPFNVVVKASLSHLPFLEKAAAHMGLVPVGRKNPKEDLLHIFAEGTKRIAAGSSFLIFPQGSREKVFSRKLYSSIGAKLAEKANVPVVPIAVKTDMEPTRPNSVGWLKDFGTVDPSREIRIACGPVLTGKAREMHQASFDWIADKVESWGMPVER